MFMLPILAPIVVKEASQILNYIGHPVFHSDAVSAFESATGINLENTPSGQVAKLYSELTPDQKQALKDEGKKLVALVKSKSTTRVGRIQLLIAGGAGAFISMVVMALWAFHPIVSAAS